MLRELHISNLAVIADARVEFAPGLNCFTGVTGAGKSLVIGAIEVLLGLRSPADMLRPGADEGRVSGVFDIADPLLLRELESATDLSLSTDAGELLLVRRVFASGRSTVSVNGHPITLAMLRRAAEVLVDVHGQHDHQFLLRPSNQLTVLDEFASATALRDEYEQAWRRLRDAQRQLETLRAGRSLRQQQLELYRVQANEIDSAGVDEREYDELTTRAAVLSNLEKLKRDAGAAHAALYDSEGSILERLKMLSAVLSELAGLDASVGGVAASARDATVLLEECAFDLGRYLDKLDLDPSELAEVSDRLTTLNRLMHKYGDPLSTVVAHRRELDRQIAELERESDDLTAVESELGALERQVHALAAKLSARRQAGARQLAPRIESQLAELGMERARFAIELRRRADGPDASGADDIEFLAQTNPGLPAQPLRKIASGGELSRVMLALKGVLATAGERVSVSVLVFDEIDANVGGRLGATIGAKLRDLAARHQVLCITHLPQIASYADRHLTVRKENDGDQTRTTVRPLSGDDRLRELAEMIGGHRVTPTTLAQARELVGLATMTPAPVVASSVSRATPAAGATASGAARGSTQHRDPLPPATARTRPGRAAPGASQRSVRVASASTPRTRIRRA